MARADLILDLVEAGQRSDRARFAAVVEAMIAEERANQHHLLADRLSAIVTTHGKEPQRDELARSVADLVADLVPYRSLADVYLTSANGTDVSEFVEENRRSELLRSYGLEPRSRLLLQGPPGNGKSTLAEAIANELMLPLYSLRYEGVVSSFLGETAARLDRVFEFVRSRRCVLLIDEFDSIAKERSDPHETGEIKRVVSTLLLQIDRLPAHVVLVAATNHAGMLDSAAGRRFQMHLSLGPPSRAQREAYFEPHRTMFSAAGLSPRTLADRLVGASFSDLEELVLTVRRRQVLGQPNPDMRAIVRHAIARVRRAADVPADD